MTKGPRGLAHQRVHTGPNLISPQTLKAYLHSRLILPFSHHAQLHTYNQPLLILHPALFPQSLCFKKQQILFCKKRATPFRENTLSGHRLRLRLENIF